MGVPRQDRSEADVWDSSRQWLTPSCQQKGFTHQPRQGKENRRQRAKGEARICAGDLPSVAFQCLPHQLSYVVGYTENNQMPFSNCCLAGCSTSHKPSVGPEAPNVFTLSVKKKKTNQKQTKNQPSKPTVTTNTDAAGSAFYKNAEYLNAGDTSATQVAGVNSALKVRATLHPPDKGERFLR